MARKEVFKNAKDLYEPRNKIIKEFRDSIFPLAKYVQKKNRQKNEVLNRCTDQKMN